MLQLMNMMYKLRTQSLYEKNVVRVTRQAYKYTFELNNISTDLYPRSPYCVGALFWNDLSKGIQDKETKKKFKNSIADMLV